MKKKKINLINLSVQKKFKSNFKALGLNYRNTYMIGDWCNLNKNFFNIRKTFRYLDYFKVKNYKQKSRDSSEIYKYYELCLSHLTKNLNVIHKTNYNKKFWQLLLSRWLFTYVIHNFSRWDLVKKINYDFSLDKIITFNFTEKSFVPENSQHAHFMMQSMKNDNWSINVINQILKFKNKNLKLHAIKYKNTKDIKEKQYRELKFYDVLNVCIGKKIFFYNLDLVKKFKYLLMSKNNFFNMSYLLKKISISDKFNNEIRNKISNVKNKKSNDFYSFLISSFKYNLPKIFLENFQLLEKTYGSLNWPKNPQYIITSYGQYYDEIFKLYSAHKQKKNKSKLYILQHGYNNIFTDGDFYAGNLDKKISDKFLTWGNLKKDNSLPFIFPKHKNRIIKEKNDYKKKSLIILYSFNETLLRPLNGFLSGTSVNKIIVESVVNFLSPIDRKKLNLLKNIEVKYLNGSITNSVSNTLKFKFPFLKFHKQNQSFEDVINNYRITFHFFLGTPFIESMYYNKPCLLILKRDIHLNFDKTFNSILKELIRVKICFENSKEAFEFFEKNNKNLNFWWNSTRVQKIRKLYCNKYCANFDTKNNIFEKIFD